jgi:hypothetical protein
MNACAAAKCSMRQDKVSHSVMVEINQVAVSVRHDYVGWRVDNFRLAWLHQRQHSHSGCPCRERIHVELVMN